MVDRFKNSVKGALAGALFGILFAVAATFFRGGPDLTTGIMETWWWFSALGAFAGLFAPLGGASSK
jgi:CDP-diglyceride synthetase